MQELCSVEIELLQLFCAFVQIAAQIPFAMLLSADVFERLNKNQKVVQKTKHNNKLRTSFATKASMSLQIQTSFNSILLGFDQVSCL